MKTALLLLALVLPAAAFAEVQFNGVLIDGNGKTKVSLMNTDTQDSHWVAINGKFGGYTVVAYKAGKAANPAIRGDTGIKDTVVLALPGGSNQTVAMTDAVLNTTPATSMVSIASGQPTTATAALTDRLNAEMAKPNADPALIQALQQSLARQQAQPTTTSVLNASSSTFNTVSAPAANGGTIRLDSNVVNGQPVQTVTVNGQTTVIQPGQNPNDVIRAARAAGPTP